MGIHDLAFAPVLLPLFGAALAFLAKTFGKGRLSRILVPVAAVVGLLLPWVALVGLLPSVLEGRALTGIVGNWASPLGIVYRFDGLGWLVNALGFLIAGSAWVYAWGKGPKGPFFTGVFLIQTAALSATVLTADLFNLFVSLEIMGIASYILIATSEKPGALLASLSYLLVSAASMVFFLLGLYGFYRLTGSLSYTEIGEALRLLPDGGGPTIAASLGFIVGAVAIRAALMPLYGWLPEAHALAPHPVSAVLSGVLIKTPLFALGRLLLELPLGAAAGEALGWSSAAAALVGSVIALSQTDAKRLLAYSSISHIGFIVAAWGSAVSVGPQSATGALLMAAAFLHALFHAAFKGLLFLSVGTVTDTLGDRNLDTARGALHSSYRLRFVFACYLAGGLSMAALPPFSGYFSKVFLGHVLEATWKDGLLVMAGIVTMAGALRLSSVFLPGRGQPPPALALPIPPTSKISLAVLAIVTLAAGWALFPVWHSLASLLGAGSFPNLPWFSGSSLLKTGATLILGLLLFFLSRTSAGKGVMLLIRDRPRSFHGLFAAFALGSSALALYLLQLT